MDSDKYLEGQSMQRPPLFESDSFIYWKNRFETYVKSKDLDLWHVITNGDFQPIIQNPETKLDEVVPFEKQTDDLKRKLAKNNEAKMVIYNALPRKNMKGFSCVIRQNKFGKLYESIDSAFARFNTIITSLKALDEDVHRRHKTENQKNDFCSEDEEMPLWQETSRSFFKKRCRFRKTTSERQNERKCFRFMRSKSSYGESPKPPERQELKSIRWRFLELIRWKRIDDKIQDEHMSCTQAPNEIFLVVNLEPN
ncbi:hypothetical protein Tco_0846716 [Tanacetum coccineum]